jgi:hypothetical protein
MSPIYIWQRIISPHMTGLAAALAATGREVTYVAEEAMCPARAQQGWQRPNCGGARLELAPSAYAVRAVVNDAATDSVHLCQGIRSNGSVGSAQKALARRGLRQWVLMETVEDAGWRGALKRLEYMRLLSLWRSSLQGVLATGWQTPAWVVARGMPENRVFPFAYFLPDNGLGHAASAEEGRPYRYAFVGQLIARKRLDLLMSALGGLAARDVELVIIGGGPLEPELRRLAETVCPGRVHWKGPLPMAEVPQELAGADCLVLPSRHDGWGAVVSEALMVGTPAVCSDACGAAEVVFASGVGGVFPSGDRGALGGMLGDMVKRGRLSAGQRRELANWAQALGATAGAKYLLSILDHVNGEGARPSPPWRSGRRAASAMVRAAAQ